MQIGIFGSVVFEVSGQKVLTFDDYSRTVKHRYQTHSILNGKPKLESVGADLIEISLKIKLSAFLNVNPKLELEKLRRMCENAEVNFLIIGSEKIGDNQFVIEEVSEDVKHWTNRGEMLDVDATVKFKEYVK